MPPSGPDPSPGTPDDRPHLPVLWQETVAMVDPQPGGTVVDGTFGAGGHAGLVAERLGADGTLVVVDRDPVALEIAARFAAEAPCRVRIVAAPFAEAFEQLAAEGFRADGAYFDLGMSSMQIDQAERGFAYTRDAPLDMRMGMGGASDPDEDGAVLTSAAEIVATWDVPDLTRALRDLGEERYALKIAKAIVREREKAPIETTGRLVDVVTGAIPTPARHVGGHPAKRTFQALRMEVNDELAVLRRALPAAIEAIGVGGRVVVESYHSLEDRLVKQAFTAVTRSTVPVDLPFVPEGQEPPLRLVTRGAEKADDSEIAANPRAASVRLRAVERVHTTRTTSRKEPRR